MKQVHRIIKGKIVQILFGLLFVWIATAMVLSESFDLDCFYNAGNVYQQEGSVLRRTSGAWSYNQDERLIEIKDDLASCYFPIKDKSTEWNYLIFDVESMSQESIEFEIEMYDKKGNVCDTIPVEVKAGRNIVELSSMPYSGYRIEVTGGIGVKFWIASMILRQKIIDWSWQKLLLGLVIGISVYVPVLYLTIKLKIKTCWKSIRNNFMKGIQRFFSLILRKIKMSIDAKKRRMIRIGILLFLFSSMHVRELWSANMIGNLYRVQFVYCLCIIVLALLLAQEVEEIHERNWNNPLFWSYFSVIVVECISDFLVKKMYPFEGYMRLFVFGILYFAWNNLKKRKLFLDEMIFALKIDFISCIIFCVLCRPFTQGVSYLGCYTNPNTFGMYLVIILGALLQSVWNNIRTHGKMIAMSGDMVLTIAAMNLLWKSQCRGAMLAFGIAVMSAVIIICVRKKSEEVLCGIKAGILLAALMLPVGALLNYGLETVPEKVGTVVGFEQDEYIEYNPKESFWVETVKAESLKDKLSNSKWGERFQAKSVEEFSSGRTTIWKACLRNMNLYGHYFKVKVNGEEFYAHNEVLQHAFNYGIFMIVPYGLMIFYIIRYAWSYGLRGKEEWIFIWNIFSSWIVMGMIDVTELPFRLFTWLIPCLLMGILFESQDKKELKC